MKLLTFKKNNQERLGLLKENWVIDLALVYNCLHSDKNRFPLCMISLLEEGLEKARIVDKVVKEDFELLRKRVPEAFSTLEEVKLLAPIPRTRKNIVCVGQNYADHAEEVSKFFDLPKTPDFFTKASTSIIGPNHPIILPTFSNEVDYEVELAFIFGKKGKNISKREALDHIIGYTVFNDVTARDLQKRHLHWFKAKSLDTFGPMGPYLVTKDEVPNPHNLEITMKVNGKIMQKSNTKNMYFKIPALVEALSKDMTIDIGDVVATGTPGGVGFTRKPPIFLNSGDLVEAYVEKIGVLRNRVVSPIKEHI